MIRDASFTIPHRTFVYVAGTAGSGKSTLLRAVAGIIPRVLGEVAGRIEVAGVDTTELSLAEVGTLAAYMEPDVEANILGLTVGQEMLFLVGREAEARACLEVMDIAGLWDRETTKLSGGQQVRLLLAGMLASQAPLLLFDDPLDQLDPEGGHDFIGALSQLHHHGATILVSDRHWSVVESLVDIVLPIAGGSVGPMTTRLNLESSLEQLGVGDPEIRLRPQTTRDGDRVAAMRDVCVRLEGHEILTDINLDVAGGEFVAIQGPNGSGKTTAMLTLAGALMPTRGKVERAGPVGYVFQDVTYQMVAPSTYDEIALAPRLRGYAEEKVNEVVMRALKWCELSGREVTCDLHPQQLKLLAVAAMSIDVELLILDEPTVGLDVAGIRRLFNFLEELRGKGVALIVVSHERFVAQGASRIVHFCGGRIVR